MNCQNLKIYKQIIKTGLIRSLTYKFEVYSNILMQTIIMICGAFFWKALFKNTQSVKGVTAETMLTYVIISSVIAVTLSTGVERRIQQSVDRGTVAIDLVRPVNIFSMYFAEDIATLIALFFQNTIPIILIGSIVVGIPKPASIGAFLLFVFSVIIAYLVNWLIAVMFGMICFSQIHVDALFQVKKHLIRLLSGSIIPIWFFPTWLKAILEALPFAYLYQLPLNIYIGKVTGDEIVIGLLIQLAWLIVEFVLFMYLQNKVAKKVLVQGG